MVDFRLPDDTGINILTHIKEKWPETHVILMTRYSDIRIAISSIKLGALDYIVKPINPEELLLTIENAFKAGPEQKKPATQPKHNYIIGTSTKAKSLYEQISVVAPTNFSVIIEGESGTGKEYAAQLIHSKSQRKDEPFIAVDCGALAKELSSSELFGHIKGAFTGAIIDKRGHFEAANGGTLFLDEIGNLSYDIQVQLLRAIQERKIKRVGDQKDISVDVRIIAATNEELRDQVDKGFFRADLFHRLNEFSIQAPALREREHDIIAFSDFFIQMANEELNKKVRGLSPEVTTIFLNYSWPGNIRELKNIIRRSVLLSKSEFIEIETIPEDLLKPAEKIDTKLSLNLKEVQQEAEKEKIVRALQTCRYNKTKAAQLLNIDRKTLYLKIEKYQIDC